MRIQLLFWEGCPSHPHALARLQQIMTEEGIDEEVEIIEITTEEDAVRWRFYGSPTLLVDGQDIDPPPAAAPALLTCRTYFWPNGHISPLPHPDTIRSALRSAKRE